MRRISDCISIPVLNNEHICVPFSNPIVTFKFKWDSKWEVPKVIVLKYASDQKLFIRFEIKTMQRTELRFKSLIVMAYPDYV